MNSRINPKQLIFFTAYSLFVVLALSRTTFFYQYYAGKAFNVALALCIVLAIVGEFFLGKSINRMIVGMFVCAAYIVLAIYVKATFYLILSATVILVFCARDIPFRKTARVSAWVLFIAFCIIVVSSKVGLIDNYVENTNGRIRQYLGFLFALYPSTVMMNITMLAVYVRRERMFWAEIVAFIAGGYLVFKMTGSRLSFIISMIVILFAVFMKIWPDFFVNKTRIKKIVALAYIICSLVSLVISVKYDHAISWQAKLNGVFSDRFRLQQIAMEEYGFSLFGQDIHANGNALTITGEVDPILEEEEYFYVDNMYIQWYVKNGFVFFIVMIVLFTVMSYRSIRFEKQGYLLFMMVMMAIFCLIQDSLLFVHFNSFILCAGNLLIGKETEEELEAKDGYYLWFTKKKYITNKRRYRFRQQRQTGFRW